jgi:hypothetical protein
MGLFSMGSSSLGAVSETGGTSSLAGVAGPTSFSLFSVVGLVTLLKREPKTEPRLAFFSVGEAVFSAGAAVSAGVSSFFSSLLSETMAAGARRVSQVNKTS